MAPGGGTGLGAGPGAAPPGRDVGPLPSDREDDGRGGIGTFCVPTAGDMERDPLEPVGLGVGLRCGVEARPAPPLPPESLLF